VGDKLGVPFDHLLAGQALLVDPPASGGVPAPARTQRRCVRGGRS
jgi:hypothetical protein